ncbi:MAG: hypothetical protein J6S38_02180, partial [Erysipelotrichaceae bacterium]|nr:hypothetical protein [Erysipelotrichaceae bacterium]
MKKTVHWIMHILLVPLVIMLAFSDCLQVIEAENEYVGSLNGKKYDDFEDLCDDLKDDYENRTVVIEMLTDWVVTSHSIFYTDEFDYRLYIPENCNATLNMHGHIFDRDLVGDNDYNIDGELIYVEVDATLTINGASNDGERGIEHTGVKVFSDTDKAKANSTITTYGGTLAGGNGLAGTGGIYIDSGKDVYINDVTIAGCKAYYYFMYSAFHSGYGGGIIITEDNTKLHLKNSTITGCLAEQDGGGIYAKDDDNITIELDNSHVDKNYANSDGGGINMDGENLLITGKNNSSISFNKTNGYGGGVYFWNDEVVLNGVTVESNFAVDDGGGVYLQEEDSVIKNCIIRNNNTNGVGGGVYINNDYTEINNTTITGNYHFGVYVNSGCDKGVSILGKTIIKNNTDKSGNPNNKGNLRLEDNTSYLIFDQNDVMEVYLSYDSNPSSYYRINLEPCKDFSNHIFSDNDTFIVGYSYYEIARGDSQDLEGDSTARYLVYINKNELANYPSVKVRSEPEIIEIDPHDYHAYTDGTLVYKGGYTADEKTSVERYELRTVYPRHTSGGDKNFKMYYSDGFFFDDPIIYNDHLATASFALASAGSYLDAYNSEYEYKHAGTRQLLADIGCPDQMIYVDDYNIMEPGTDTIGVSIGSKVLQQYDESTGKLKDTDYKLVVITTRGANYENEWASNVMLGDGSQYDGEALGFAEAAEQVMIALDFYLDKYGFRQDLENGRVKFWVTGFSRGGATANLLSKRIIERYIYKTDLDQSPTGNEIFAYPCEAPRGGTDNAEKL